VLIFDYSDGTKEQPNLEYTIPAQVGTHTGELK
jgi:hypothetical protein